MRLIPRLSSKQKIWPGGPELGDVVKSQLSPPEAAGALAVAPDGRVPPIGPAPILGDQAAAEHPGSAVELLMVLR